MLFHVILLSALLLQQTQEDHTFYHTKRRSSISLYGDCVYKYTSVSTSDNPFKPAWQLLPHCVWPYGLRIKYHNSVFCYGGSEKRYTFKRLGNLNISSSKLFSWNSDVDLVDLYHLYVIHNLQQLENETVCKCSTESGNRCQYQLSHARFRTMDNFQIDITDKSLIRAYDQAVNSLTCYPGLPSCISALPCLDWRQLCDGVIDCVNGEDEERCLEMEMNECNDETEFRCKDGRCIPKEFAFDRIFDCLDHSDEHEIVDIDSFHDCTYYPSMECEERNKAWHQFSCGDGEIIRYPLKACQNGRDWLVFHHLFGNQSMYTLNRTCYDYMSCKTVLKYGADKFSEIPPILCESYNDRELLLTCPSMFFFPSNSVLFPFVKLLFISNSINQTEDIHLPTYICYYDYMCLKMKFSISIEMNNTKYRCILLKNHHLFKSIDSWHELLGQMYNLFSSCHLNKHENASSVLYECAESSKYISKHRLKDGFIDCYMGDDEDYLNICDLNLLNKFQCLSNKNECIHRNMLLDSIFDCSDGSDELYQFGCKQANDYGCKLLRGESNSLSFGSYLFQELCNGVRWGLMTINNQTDETSCEQWPYTCDSPYVLCDGIWNCKDGRDEINCSSKLMTIPNCTEHYCQDIRNSSSLICLSSKKAGNTIVDCLGEIDERHDGYCSKKYPMNLRKRYRCNQSDICIDPMSMCNGLKDCPNLDDELLCPWMLNKNLLAITDFQCQKESEKKSNVLRCDNIPTCDLGEDEWLCNIVEKRSDKPFLLNRIIKTTNFEVVNHRQRRQKSFISKELLKDIENCQESCDTGFLFPLDDDVYNDECCKDCELCMLSIYPPDNIDDCRHGKSVFTYTASVHRPEIIRCFCPPTYWGEACEYQTERISVVLQIDTLNGYNTIQNRSSAFIFFISLFFENDTIMFVDSEQLFVSHYAQVNQKHIIYLRYPHPKPPGQYFIKIDSYISNISFAKYTGRSWFYHVQFPFLPVGRLAVRLIMNDKIDSFQENICEKSAHISNSRCLTYVNNNTKMFLLCDNGWTGDYCERKANHLCPNGSECVYGCDHFETSICICPLGQIGAHCSITFNPCPKISCQNGGTCVPLDERSLNYFCACNAGFFGSKCENIASKMTILISSNLLSSVSTIPAAVVHFGILKSSMNGIMIHRNQFLFTNLDSKTSKLTIFDEKYEYLPTFALFQVFLNSQPYYGMFYMIEILQNNQFKNLNSSVTESKHCPHVSQLLDATINGYTSLKRVKYYHQICMLSTSPNCFFDETYMCFCDRFSRADCLIFDYYNIDCRFCQNQGRCITVQQQLTCVCPECYYGSLCQFTSLKYSATFDSLLGNSIVENVAFSDMPIIIKIVVVIVVLMTLFGLIGNSMCFLVFLHKNTHETGCGYYLLCLSIINQIGLFILSIKLIFSILMPSSSLIMCIALEYSLKYFPHVSDWFTAVIAIERAITVVKGTSFNKKRSIRITKFVIITLLLIVAASLIHIIFIYEMVVNPFNLNSSSCIKTMNSKIAKIYEPTINIIQLIFPILIHIVSTLTFLINITRRKTLCLMHSVSDKKRIFHQIFKEQLIMYKPFVLGPLFIICLSLPRLIVSFAFACVKHSWQQYLYLAGYLISFIPLTGTIFIFVLPSPIYRKILIENIFKKCKTIY
jgi:hypothetical protein